MQKIINDPNAFVDETLEGILLAHPDALRLADDPRAIVRADSPVADKVGIATGGGSGHLPVFLGYVGEGLADGVAVGEVFASPSMDQMLAVTRAVSAGRGVLHLYGNYGGDRMNFELAAELAADDGIEVRTVRCADDVTSAPKGSEDKRRGVAGIFFLYKVAGASAAEGADLDKVTQAAELARDNVRSMGVALSPCTVPAAGVPTFELPAGMMEVGMGIHGEPGVGRSELRTADAIAEDLVSRIIGDLPFARGDEVAVLVNGLGGTPKEELYILYRRTHQLLQEQGIAVYRTWLGEYATSLEMAGASVSLMRLDDGLKRLLDAPAHSPFFTQR